MVSGNIQNICPHQVGSTNVVASGQYDNNIRHEYEHEYQYLFNGTLLQNAVYEGKTDFARLLLEFG